MITLPEWKLIGMALFVTFFISAIVCAVINKIIEKIKNKNVRKCKTVSHKKQKTTFKVDCEEFMKKYFKDQDFLYENKNRQAELIRLLNY